MMDIEITNSITEFQAMGEDNVFPIDKINWWLLKNEDLYRYCKANWNKGSVFGDLPDLNTFTSLPYKFFKFWQDINVIAEEAKCEPICNQALGQYQLIKDDAVELKAWMVKNYTLGTKTLMTFMLDHLDYEGCQEDSILIVFNSTFEELEIFADRKYFLAIIEFVELYHDLFFVQALYPEELERIYKEIEALPKLGEP